MIDRRCRVALLCLGLAVRCTVGVAAQEALVLSGGGSRGLVHAGVIEALEERGYDADLVVGTSMGAVVGALYAAGYSPEDIIERIREVDWTEVFSPTPVVIGPDRAVRYPLVNFDLRIEERRFSRGLISQWRINRELVRLLFDANSRIGGDFDRLPRRYRAVAADLRTGERVVLAEGDLALAARASLAVPGIFAPVVSDGRVLADGGITDNLPTRVARAIGASRVLAVDVSRPPAEIVDTSPLGLIQRAIDLLQENTQQDSIAPDLLILPRTELLIGSIFPSDPDPLFEIGRAAVREVVPNPDAKRPRTERQLDPPPPTVDRVVVQAADSSLTALARAAFDGIVPGPYDPAAVLDAIDRLYATGLFEGVWPRVVPDSAGGNVLLLQLNSPPRLSLGASAAYDNDRGALVWLALERHGSIRRRPTLTELSVSTTGLDHWISTAATVFPRDRTLPAASIGLYARERDVRFFGENGSGTYDVFRFGAWSGIELPYVLRDQLASVTLHLERVRIEQGVPGLSYGPRVRFTRVDPKLLVVGHPFLLEAEHRWGTPAYSRVAVRVSRVFEARPLAVAPLVDLAWTTDDSPPDVQPALGDEHAVPGFRWGERRAPARVILGIDSSLAVSPLHLRLRLRAGVADRTLSSDADWVAGTQLGAVWHTPIWSAEAGFGANTTGARRFEVLVGRMF